MRNGISDEQIRQQIESGTRYYSPHLTKEENEELNRIAIEAQNENSQDQNRL